jgi:hypothetical protein
LSCAFSSCRARNDDESSASNDEESAPNALDGGKLPDVVITGSNDFPSSLAD